MPRTQFGSTYFAVERQRQIAAQVAENSARQAEAVTTFITNGAGQVAPDEPIRFASPFLAEPAALYGYVVDVIPNGQYWQYPRCSGGVARWVRNSDGFYVGFYPIITVHCPPQPLVGTVSQAQVQAYRQTLAANRPRVDVTHHFTFRAESYKRLPTHVEEAIKNMER